MCLNPLDASYIEQLECELAEATAHNFDLRQSWWRIHNLALAVRNPELAQALKAERASVWGGEREGRSPSQKKEEENPSSSGLMSLRAPKGGVIGFRVPSGDEQ